MTTVQLDGPTNILVIEGLTMPEAKPEYLADIGAAAPSGSTIQVAKNMKEAAAMGADAEVILGIVTERLFPAVPKLRWVHAIASGVDSLMFPDFVNSDIVLTGEKGLVGGHLADTGWGLLLALTRQIHTAIKLGPDAWDHRVDMRMKEIELEGMTMGIVGFGGTGRAMAKRAVAFGMHTIAVDEFPSPPDHGVEEVWPADQLDDLLAQSDVVAVCCPLTPTTDKLFDADVLAKMKPGSYIVNVTRGECVDGPALVAALKGHLGGAALDVAPGEPLPKDHELFTLDNVAMTPHTAGASQLRAPRNVARFVDNLKRAQKGEPFDGVVDKKLGY
ncbi:MAG: D-2-hydroxyacid dehydrogenase [Acidimicrobiia bacterium]|nr:D-2-hydroxyacid dehydrogenase [Acidimicrobiia bacterium]